MKKTIAQLKDKFPIKDLGPLEYCLGIKITRNRTKGTLTLSQRKLVEDILEKYDMADCKPIQTPMTVPCKLSSNVFDVGVYVDDLPIASNSICGMKKTIAQLKDKFPVKALGPLEYCLGIKITRSRTKGTLTLSQRKLVEDILEKYDMADCKPIQTPMTVPFKLSSNDSPQTKMEEQLMKTLPYRQILGSIRYLVSCTRPDLSFCVGFLSRFM
jgi:hypothetical protein